MLFETKPKFQMSGSGRLKAWYFPLATKKHNLLNFLQACGPWRVLNFLPSAFLFELQSFLGCHMIAVLGFSN